MGQTEPDPTGDSLLSRIMTPMVLLAPLAIGLPLFGIIYGGRSSQVAADIDALAPLLVIDSPEGVRMAPHRLCPDARAELDDLVFHRLDPDDPSRKSSLSGLGFDRGVIDLKGWLEDPNGDANTAGNGDLSTDAGSDRADGASGDDRESPTEGSPTAAASDPAAQDNRDDISFELQRTDGTWCVVDVAVR